MDVAVATALKDGRTSSLAKKEGKEFLVEEKAQREQE